ncbi:toll/interleukin-1 receptor domain-containing protein [Rhodopseudomonas palustris]|nr:toll/interleukin-1 receptor domain-containing protein [Rhodopseudomonas palustris]
MKIFVSWSGERSQQLAQALRDWLPLVLHFAEPWVSQSDIDAGDRWANEVGKELEASNFGLICITSENVASPWILFEAGALSKSMQEGRVVPLLLDIEFRELTGPLAQFQAKKLENSGLWDILGSINRIAEHPIPEPRLRQLFDALWPELEKNVHEIPKTPQQKKPTRPQQEILEELVSSIRGLDSRFRDFGEETPSRDRRRKRLLHPFMIDEMVRQLDLGRNDPTKFLVFGSIVRDDVPWLSELLMETFRETTSGGSKRALEAERRLLAGFKAFRHGPWSELMQDRDTFHLIAKMTQIFEEKYISRDRNFPWHRVDPLSSEKPNEEDINSP